MSYALLVFLDQKADDHLNGIIIVLSTTTTKKKIRLKVLSLSRLPEASLSMLWPPWFLFNFPSYLLEKNHMPANQNNPDNRSKVWLHFLDKLSSYKDNIWPLE